MIQVKNVHKQFGAQKVLDGISFSVEKGTVTTIIGRSGSGKSVLLKHLIGLVKPDSGDILIDGENIVRMRGPEVIKLRRRFGILFQDGALFDSLTVAENVAFPIREHTKLRDAEVMDLVHRKLSVVGMTGHDEKLPAQISGGMRKRVGLARALALDPDIVFFDEPTTGLDPLTKGAIYDLIKRTHSNASITYVIVSHDIQGVFGVSDEVMMLWDGKILASGTPEVMRRSTHPVVRQFLNGTADGPIRID